MSRRQARERALQILFQVDVGGADPGEAFRLMDEGFGELKKYQEFARLLVGGTLENLAAIDRVIAGVSKDWNINRMANVDRNIIRMALYEIFFCEDIPYSVSVNEAVELGKTYGGEESGRFINGILGRIVESPEEYRPLIKGSAS
ncbi:MAG: transcription antitermination factor NusB [Pelotomaculum sp.]|uniref:Transcription antitermination protein NusB n=1 Tax=Pelotomaculum thermopropionicum (strain DSM 13744 / JCM 10971 / SI) TaxID=370438 RepID=NUSB_PELTS|nr:RecName: Full=Transcription antitermination protein NusB; AltName: Full=Antitermination factor NusB [Pelotomaculum thermopropionicum SI]NPV72397.1 transcription antitermination factor NusB [Pelotomaculum sp.]BAF59360.1 transcription termination factor [Pelotomaculum thermopropionicum SI]